MEQVIASKEAAEITLLPNRTVRKRYTSTDGRRRVEQDLRSLIEIGRRFRTVRVGDWTYAFVEVQQVRLDPPYVDMEHISGQAIPDLPRPAINEAEQHCGTWLAHYHRQFLGEAAVGPIYTDCGAANFIIDFERKRLTAIDPGMRWGEIGHAYEDVLLHVNTIVLSLIAKYRKAGLRDVLSFVESYADSSAVHFSAEAYYAAYLKATAYNLRELSKRSLWKTASSVLLLTTLSPLYLLGIPLVLSRADANDNT